MTAAAQRYEAILFEVTELVHQQTRTTNDLIAAVEASETQIQTIDYFPYAERIDIPHRDAG